MPYKGLRAHSILDISYSLRTLLHCWLLSMLGTMCSLQNGRQQPPFNLHLQTLSIRTSLRTPSMVLREHAIPGTSRSPYPRYFVLTPSQVLREHAIAGTSCSSYPRYFVLTPIPGTSCSPHLWYFVLTPSQVLHAHPINGTPCSPHLE